MREESSTQNRDFMLDYLINLPEDATDFSWALAKASHAVLLCRMEQGEIKSWAEMEKIDRVRRAHAQRHVATTPGTSRNIEKTHINGKTVPCVYFNKGSCLQKQSQLLAVGRQFTVQNPSELYVLVSSALPTTRRDMTCTVLKAT